MAPRRARRRLKHGILLAVVLTAGAPLAWTGSWRRLLLQGALLQAVPGVAGAVQLPMPKDDCPDCKLDTSGGAVATIDDRIRGLISKKPVVIFSKTYCPYCAAAKEALAREGVAFETVELDLLSEKEAQAFQASLGKMTGARTVPRVFVNGRCIGGGDETVSLQRSGKLRSLLKASSAVA
eukprot:TRINITY_DN54471_c0_g1_i1.p1 TRINITY_DN54471_c0_g1~~TRINITY_DN54471_c0_g1_i1.p1  ORF type:complete len:192 (+),score=50.53 TRINITY_DN54471_c0_g1_i1:39-578(+)